jgi:hypothetical protein
METAAQAFVLFFYLWNPSTQSSNPVSTAEFSSKQTCESAGQRASDKFGGVLAKPIYICVPK